MICILASHELFSGPKFCEETASVFPSAKPHSSLPLLTLLKSQLMVHPLWVFLLPSIFQDLLLYFLMTILMAKSGQLSMFLCELLYRRNHGQDFPCTFHYLLHRKVSTYWPGFTINHLFSDPFNSSTPEEQSIFPSVIVWLLYNSKSDVMRTHTPILI